MSEQVKYVVLIEVDPIVVWRLTSKAMLGMDAMMDRRKRLIDSLAESKVDPYLKMRLLDRLVSTEEKLKRLHNLSRYAKANFRVEESDAMMLAAIEDGSLLEKFEFEIYYGERVCGVTVAPSQSDPS